MSRLIMKAFAPAMALIGALTVVSPASATNTSFAQYTGDKLSFTATQHPNTVTLSETTPVTFSFLNTSLASVVKNVTANLTFSAIGLNINYSKIGGFADQESLGGSYKFTSTQAYTIGSQTFATGSNLLTVVFSDASLFGKVGGVDALFSSDTTIVGTITYTSDFLTFTNTVSDDFSIALGAISPKLGGVSLLNGFTSTPTGTFSSDPAPIKTAPFPEPATWLMMLVGFGAIGIGLRTSKRRNLGAA